MPMSLNWSFRPTIISAMHSLDRASMAWVISLVVSALLPASSSEENLKAFLVMMPALIARRPLAASSSMAFEKRCMALPMKGSVVVAIWGPTAGTREFMASVTVEGMSRASMERR